MAGFLDFWWRPGPALLGVLDAANLPKDSRRTLASCFTHDFTEPLGNGSRKATGRDRVRLRVGTNNGPRPEKEPSCTRDSQAGNLRYGTAWSGASDESVGVSRVRPAATGR